MERGAAYTAKKMYARAIDEYARALDFDPGRAVIHRRLAELYLQKGDPAGAALHTKEADKLEKGRKVRLALLWIDRSGLTAIGDCRATPRRPDSKERSGAGYGSRTRLNQLGRLTPDR